jgi:hypothetical protein
MMKIVSIFLVAFFCMSMQSADKALKNTKKTNHRCAKGEKQAIAKALNKLTQQGQCKTTMHKHDIDQIFEEAVSPRTPKQK